MNEEARINDLPEGLYRGQYARTDELNSRIMERNEPESPLPPNFSPRPVLSKYALFPMLDSRMKSNEQINTNENYSLTNNFTPPVMKNGPVSGVINNINTESDLRNMNYALQKGAGQDVYIPSSDSDLYKVTVTNSPSVQPYPGLFTQQHFSQVVHENVTDAPHIGSDVFRNNTRTQLRGEKP